VVTYFRYVARSFLFVVCTLLPDAIAYHGGGQARILGCVTEPTGLSLRLHLCLCKHSGSRTSKSSANSSSLFGFASFILHYAGLELRPGDATPLELRDGEVLHVSMVSLGTKLADKSGRSVITARVGEDPVLYALCALVAGKTESFSLDLTFQGEETLVLEVSGKNPVSLVGNFGYEDDDDEDEDDGHLINMYDDDGMMGDEDDESDEGDEDDDDMAPKLIKDADPPVITELPDEPKPNVPATVNKKAKATGQPPAPVKTVKPGGSSAKRTPAAKNGGGSRKGKVAEESEEEEDDEDDDVEVGDEDDEDLEDEDEAHEDEEDVEEVVRATGQKPGSSGQKRGPSGHAGHTPSAKKAKTGRPATPANPNTAGRGSGRATHKDDAGPKTPKQSNGTTPKPILKRGNEARQGAGQKAGSSSGARASGASTPAPKEHARDASSGSGPSSGSGKKRNRRRKSKGGGDSSA
jgi:hypothetical protein